MAGVDDLERIAADAAAGDPLAAATLVRSTQSDVWRLCAALGDRDTADDLTQETYLRAFGSLHRFEGRSSVRTWLLAIARRVCADAVRSRRRRRLALVRDDDLAEVAGPGGADPVIPGGVQQHADHRQAEPEPGGALDQLAPRDAPTEPRLQQIVRRARRPILLLLPSDLIEMLGHAASSRWG